MDNENRMRRLCHFYIRWAGAIGALYCIVPSLIWFGGAFATLPFRPVYVLRMVLSLVVGTPVAAYANWFGVQLWLIKHRSDAGPATILDGSVIGAPVGMATAFVPPLTALIASNHPHEATVFIIVSWLIAIGIGTVFGGTLAAIGRKHLERSNAGKTERDA